MIPSLVNILSRLLCLCEAGRSSGGGWLRLVGGVMITTFSLLTPAACSAQQEQAAPPPKVLTGAGGKVSLGLPSFQYWGPPVCDAAGDMFFEAPHQPLLGVGPFVGIRADGGSHATYATPAELVPPSRSGHKALQAVAPGGSYYLLYSDMKRSTLIAYQGDGTVRHMQALATPSGFVPDRLAVADSGVIYVIGYVNNEEPLAKPRKAFAALFSAGGEILRKLSDGRPDTDLRAQSDKMREGGLTAGDDGRFYELAANAVLVFTQDGELERTIHFTRPSADALAARIDISAGLISIELQTVDGDKGKVGLIHPRFLVLDAQTGEQRGDYVLDSTLSNSLLCFTRQDGYILGALQGALMAKQMVPLR